MNDIKVMLLNYSNTEKGCVHAEHNKEDDIFTFFLWFYILCVKYRDIIQFCSVIIY